MKKSHRTISYRLVTSVTRSTYVVRQTTLPVRKAEPPMPNRPSHCSCCPHGRQPLHKWFSWRRVLPLLRFIELALRAFENAPVPC